MSTQSEGDAVERTPDSIWQPIIYDLQDVQHQGMMRQLETRGAVRQVHDTLVQQLEELMECRAPYEKLAGQALRGRALAHLQGSDPKHYGRWVFYPWRQELVHVLPPDEFAEVRHSRNLYKITPPEQKKLGTMRVGVVGLSVGAATAMTLALEGIGGELRLADFDTLSLSNTNRLRTSIANIGLNKAIVCARDIAELNPYLRVVLFSCGLDESNVDAFLCGGDKLDLLIEECDDLFMKVFVRERARSHHIATIMETSNRGMLDIERFDTEPDRPILHGLVGDVSANALRGLSTKQKVPYVLRIVGAKDTVGSRMLASLFEVSRTTKSWPQLASSISLGAGVAADTARRILLGEPLTSGRFYVDLDALVSDSQRAALPDWRVLDSTPISAPLAATPPAQMALLEKVWVQGSGLTRAAAEHLATYASMAPSGGNSQPWHFKLVEDRIDCSIRPGHAWTNLDFEGRSLRVALGAAAYNMLLAAPTLRLAAAVQPPSPAAPQDVICSVCFAPGNDEPSPLLAHIASRVTNRHHAKPEAPLDVAALAALQQRAAQMGAQLHIVGDRAGIAQVAAVVGMVDRITYLHPDLHRELTGEVRWTREQTAGTRTGIGVDTLELDTTDRAGAYLATTWSAMQVLRDLQLGRELETAARTYRSGAYALLTYPGQALWDYVGGGQAMQAVWLEATAQKIAMHPTSGSLYLFARLEHGGEAVFSATERTALAAARKAFYQVFPKPVVPTLDILLFRLSYAPDPTARSMRRHVSEILTVA